MCFCCSLESINRFWGASRRRILRLSGLLFWLVWCWDFFYLVQEPIPPEFLGGDLVKIGFYTFILALSEQIIFAGFLFNTYRKLTSRNDAYFQVATVFVLFHLLRFEQLVIEFWNNFAFSYLYQMTYYYILLFIFMLIALYLYSFKSKKYEGNFVYPVILHFVTDFVLILFILLTQVY